MRKEYHSSNVRFCMDDENQRRTWEYLQSITRKEGSYGKILSDAFVQILDGNHAIEQGAFQQNNAECVTEQMLSMQLATLKRELLEEMESIYGNALPAASQTGDHRDEMEQEAAEVPERNPNLYLFNCVMHLDEATPHLHIDYIPVANGYKTGMKTRNSLTKALQQMGFAKAVSKKENETVAWQQRERTYLTELCQEKGIDVEVLGVQRDNLTLPEYKAAMQKVEALEQQAEEMEIHNRELATQAGELANQIDELEARDKSNQELLAKHDLRATTLKNISKEVDAETKKIKSAAIPVNHLFGGEEYVKVKKNDWNKIMDAFSRAVSRNYLLEKYEKKIFALEKKIATLTDQIEKLKQFVASRGLGEAFVEFVKSLAPKSFKQKLEEKKADVAEQNRQRKITQQEMLDKKKKLQQEM